MAYDELIAQPTTGDYVELAQRMHQVHLSRIAEMPRLQLYLDQVLTFVNDETSPLTAADAVLTGSMVNNYVKQRVVPAPTRKRYTRRHLAYLLFVCSLKGVFSIGQLKEVLEWCEAGSIDMPRAYDGLCETFETELARCFPLEGHEAPAACEFVLYDDQGNPAQPRVAAVMAAAVRSVANKVFVEQMLALPKAD